MSALDENRRARELLVLHGINVGMANEVPASHSRLSSTTNNNSSTKNGPAPIAVTLSSDSSAVRVWRQEQRGRLCETRASVKWRIAARVHPERSRDASSEHLERRRAGVQWTLIVHRRCDLQGVVDDSSAQGQLAVSHDQGELSCGLVNRWLGR